MEPLVNFIIRPPRAEYNPINDLLDKEFLLKGKWYQRKDLEVVNSRGDVLKCSHYMPIISPEGIPLPCVIYCHGNSGCRTDASEAAIILLPSDITVFTLDFSGSGLSGGEHVTLGWNEKDDLKSVVDYLRIDENISLIGLWGRSMGAVTSLMYGAEDPSIAGMVLDSPFSDLVDLMMELVDTYKVRFPEFTVKFAIQYMRRAIQKKAKFDITDLNTIKVAKSCFVPVLFGHATDDDFIQPHHSDRIFDAYVGEKNIIKFDGDHNSPRPSFYFDSISIFFNNVLHPPEDEVGSTYLDLTQDYVPKGSRSNTHDLEYSDDLLGSAAGPWRMLRSILRNNAEVTDFVWWSRYIGYQSSGNGLLPIPEGQERYVRTLFFCGNVSNIRFSEFKSLHSLTLVGSHINELPTSIGELRHLRYLNTSKTNIKYLPDSTGELYHLQTLRAFEKGVWMDLYLEKLPDSLSGLITLRHFHIHDNTTLPSEIGKLTSLQTLSCFSVGYDKGYGISELGSLNDLKGKLAIRNLELVRDKYEATSANLLRKTGIYEIKLVWDKSREVYDENDGSVLEGLQPHPNLKGLKICGFKGKSLPLWEGLNNLIKIKLTDCCECEELPMLGHLPYLKFLCLYGLTNVKYIRCSFYGNIDNHRGDKIVAVFPALERLELIRMLNLKEWDEVDLPSQVFPGLKYLMVEGCRQLTKAPSHFPCLRELDISDMESSLPLENICGNNITSLTNLKIRNIKGLTCLPNLLFSNNHNLTKLEIWNCPNMTHLVPCLGGEGPPTLLKELEIWNCLNLRELPDDLHSLNSLEVLDIRDCPNLKSIPYPVSGSGGQRGRLDKLLKNVLLV